MPTITEIQVNYRRKDTDTLETLYDSPTAQDTGSIKLQVGRMIEQIKNEGKAEYYYVVIKVRKGDGSDGYRTIIPKTLL